MRKTFAYCLILSMLAPQNAWADIRIPYTDNGSLQKLDPDEQRVWSASDDFEKAIHKGGQIYPSVELNRYLQMVMDKLFPEFIGHIHVQAINSPVLNAFAIPNGRIYINIGLLARFENEAQLAAVLAHEGEHFVHRHGYYNQQSLKGASGFATITAILGIPIVGLLGNVVAMSSIFGYSRELETEADNKGFQRLIHAGYDVSEAARVFEHLADEVKLSDVKESVFYSTHPKLQDRVDNYRKLATEHAMTGEKRESEYSNKIKQVRMDDLELELSFARYKHLIALLSDENARKRYPNTVYYYLGEAYRKRNEENDSINARKYLDEAIRLTPQFAPAYRAKGMLLMGQQKNEEAITLFKRYLELVPNAEDKSYIESYLESLTKK